MMYILISINSTTYIENFYTSNQFYITINFGKYNICFDIPYIPYIPYSVQRIISYKEKNNIEEFFSYYN